MLLGAMMSLLSCKKDKTVGEGSITFDLDPTYGLPLANVDIHAEDIAGTINKKADDYYVEFVNDAIAGIQIAQVTWEKGDIDPIVIPAGMPALPYRDSGFYALNFLNDFRKIPGLKPHLAYLDVYVDNPSDVNIRFDLSGMYLEDSGGTRISLTNTMTDTVITANTERFHLFRAVLDNNDLANLLIMRGAKIHYTFDIVPSGSPSSNATIKFTSYLRMPCWVTLADWHRADTVNLNMESVAKYFDDTNHVYAKEGEIYIRGINAIPANVNIQIYFTDSNFVVLDTLRPEEMLHINAAIPDAAGHVVTTKDYQSIVKLTAERARMLENVAKIIISQDYSSYNQSDVKLFKENHLLLRMAIKAQGRIWGTIDEVKDELNSEN
jgi:hypothetical protein